jgi:hypothetical protein
MHSILQWNIKITSKNISIDFFKTSINVVTEIPSLAKRLLEEERSDPNTVCPDSGISAVHLAVGLAGSATENKFLELLLDHNGDPNCK